MENTNYYQDELSKVETKSIYPANLKIRSISGETKWLNLNDESANELIKWLKDNFNIVE